MFKLKEIYKFEVFNRYSRGDLVFSSISGGSRIVEKWRRLV